LRKHSAFDFGKRMQKKSWEGVDHNKEFRKLGIILLGLILVLICVVIFFVWLKKWV